MNHETTVDRYSGSLDELAVDLGDLRYDALATLLFALAKKLDADSSADARRGRPKLSACLRQGSEAIARAAEAIESAWTICEPKM